MKYREEKPCGLTPLIIGEPVGVLKVAIAGILWLPYSQVKAGLTGKEKNQFISVEVIFKPHNDCK